MQKKENEIKPIEVPEKVKLQLDNFVLKIKNEYEQKERERAEQRLAIAEDTKFFESMQTIITIIGQALIVTLAFIAAKVAEMEKFTEKTSIKYCTIIAIVLIVAIVFEILFYKFRRRKFKWF